MKSATSGIDGMVFRSRIRSLAADRSGAAAVEFAFIAFTLILFTFGVFDVGFGLYWFNRAEKATQLGVRIAAVSNPVTNYLDEFSGTVGSNPPVSGTPALAGEGCENPNTGALESFCVHPDITCSVSGGTGSCTHGDFSDAAFSKVFNEMRVLYPTLSSENVEVEYRPSLAGFAGRPSNVAGTFNLVPQVTVRIVGLRYDYIALGALLGLSHFTLPDISASMTGEDLDHTTDL